MADWKTVKLETVGCFQNGEAFSSAYFNFEKKGLRLVRNRDLKNDDQIVYYDGLHSDHDVVSDGDLLVGMDGDFTPVIWKKGKALLNQRVGRVLIKDGASQEYIYYALFSALAELEHVTSATTVKHLSSKTCLGLEIPLPPLAEQRKIAEILRTWDEAIETAEAELKAKQERKRWLAETVLSGSIRVKGHKTAWDKKRLDQIGKIVPGGTPSTSIPEYWNGDVPWVTPTEITKLKTPYIHITESLITSEGVRNSSAALLPVDSLIVCTRATVGVCAINKVPMTTNQGFKSIVPESTDDTLFLYYVLNSMQSTFNRLAQGSTFLEISKTQFEKMRVIWPEAEERRQIASLMRTADEQIEKVAERIESLRAQKRGLMQKLLTGEVRVAAYPL